MAEILNINLELLLTGNFWSTCRNLCQSASFWITKRRLGNGCT